MMDARQLTNMSPEATYLVNGESRVQITGSNVPEIAATVNDLVHDCQRQTGYRIQRQAVPIHRARELDAGRQEMALRNHPEKKAQLLH